ncbi:FkbM family methyltransferase [Rhizomonospora bruguierae]|uniref:FkbM family methyltransferase n=1 Tax=Rhizomonospora bruguierae TaxID=1581705 RepID=UPI001BD11659|nr:FkbM family methyltransferase [Micromonospora sp. NBRC 107566]
MKTVGAEPGRPGYQRDMLAGLEGRRALRDRATRAAHLAGRALLNGAVGHLPPAVAAPLRRPVPGGPMLRAVRGVLRRGGVPRAVRTFTLPDNPTLRFVNVDSLVLQQLYWFGERGWEPELLPWWRYLCRRSASILELGANVGYFTVQGAAAAPGARYTAVEPHPFSVRVCRQNLALNRIESVRVLAAAATDGDGAGRITLSIPWEQLATPTVAFVAGDCELPGSMADRPGTAITVPTADVRTLLGGVDLLKLDVEGQEHALLRAGWRQLRESRPAIVVELLPGTPQLRGVLKDLCDQLGYRCYVPAPDRLVPLGADRLAAVQVQREYGVNDVVLAARHDLPTRPVPHGGATPDLRCG